MNCCDFGKKYIRFEEEPNAYIGPAKRGCCIKMHSEVDTLGRLKWSKFLWVNIQYCPACGESVYKYYNKEKTLSFRKYLRELTGCGVMEVGKAVELYGLDEDKCLSFLRGKGLAITIKPIKESANG